jgi:hypothetical protein
MGTKEKVVDPKMQADLEEKVEDEDEKTKTDAAIGGGDGLEFEAEDQEERDIDDLHERLLKLSTKNRRRTIERLAEAHPEEQLRPTVRDRRDLDSGNMYHQHRGEFQFPPRDNLRQKSQGGQFNPVSSFGQSQFPNSLGHSQTPKQNIVVENNYKKLKVFSAKLKPGSGELDYRHWRRAAVRVVEDEDLADSKKKQLVLDSLQGRADDIVDFSKHQSVYEILSLLDSNFKAMIDGDDILADFYQMIQEERKTASEFLSDLYVELTEIVKEGGASMGRMPKLLLSQFIRGTRDEDILTKLRLEDLKTNPPSFPDLMSAVRREEGKRTERKLRLKRANVTVTRSSLVTASPEAVPELPDPDVERLQRRVNKLESMCAGLEAMTVEDVPEPETVEIPRQEVARMQRRLAQLEDKVNKVRSRSIFCYRCGEDGHVATDCNGPSNKALVLEKVEKRNQRRREYQKQNQGN